MSGIGRESASLARAAGRELLCGLAASGREVRGWRARASVIPDPLLREDALGALARKRGNVQGAALFWTLPRKRNRDLLRALVSYEVLADYLDCVSERGAARGLQNGRTLHIAMVDALDARSPVCDYYLHHDSGRDGGYAHALVEACRTSAQRLPSMQQLQGLLEQAAHTSTVLALNHEPDPVRREHALREWAEREWPRAAGMGDRAGELSEERWFERTAGASAWLTVFALLALAAEPRLRPHAGAHAQRTYETYLHSIAPLGAMLDSLGDVEEDAERGQHSYVAHYSSPQVAVARISELAREALRQARALPDGARHVAICACMIAFYLSRDSLRTGELRAGADEIAGASGPLVAALLPVLRLWRVAYGQRAA